MGDRREDAKPSIAAAGVREDIVRFLLKRLVRRWPAHDAYRPALA